MKREPFIFENEKREPVQRTADKLNKVGGEELFKVVKENGLWVIKEVEKNAKKLLK
ncbi:hypothetical protein [Bacillus phage YungSlug]|nr:hypothetical protein [Bacillus phage YungSlug]